jgi:hypothetical protein
MGQVFLDDRVRRNPDTLSQSGSDGCLYACTQAVLQEKMVVIPFR